MKLHKFASIAVGVSLLTTSLFPATVTVAQSAPFESESEIPRYSPELAMLQKQLAASGMTNVGIARAEYITTAAGFDPATSQTIIANDRQPLFSSPQFIENDPRRGGRSSLTYVVDQSDGGAFTWTGTGLVLLPNSATEPVVDKSMATWHLDTHCNGPAAEKIIDSGGNIDVFDDVVFGRPPGTPTADITHGGWISSRFFEWFQPGGSRLILAITISFIFLDESGNPTDIDQNGHADTAFVESYYNRLFAWAPSGNQDNLAIESIATHESGHAFGLDHFGRIFLTKNGPTDDEIHYAPRAVMNAVYVSPFPELTGTDRSSFCRIWANSR